MHRLDRAHHLHYIAFAIAILLTVILARTAWLLTYNLSMRLAYRVIGSRRPRMLKPPLFRNSILVAWGGMRGIVTLAAAVALPEGSGSVHACPLPDLIVLARFPR